MFRKGVSSLEYQLGSSNKKKSIEVMDNWRGGMSSTMKVFSGSANSDLAQEIADYLELPIGNMDVTLFSDDEIFVKINENIRGQDVFVVQPTCQPPNRNLVELLIIIDTLKRASAARVTAVIPYFGYSRQDRKDQPRVPITAKLVANLIVAAGADRVLTMDLHAEQIQGFFDIPCDHLYAGGVFQSYFKKLGLDDVVIVSPDVGGIKRARAYARRLNANLAIVDKRRISGSEIEVTHVIGDVKDKNVIIVDDIIATAGSFCGAVKILKEHGAKKVYGACVHPILSGPAIQRIDETPIEKLLVSNSIPPKEEVKQNPKIEYVSVAALLGEAIRRIHDNESVSSLFKN